MLHLIILTAMDTFMANLAFQSFIKVRKYLEKRRQSKTSDEYWVGTKKYSNGRFGKTYYHIHNIKQPITSSRTYHVSDYAPRNFFIFCGKLFRQKNKLRFGRNFCKRNPKKFPNRNCISLKVCIACKTFLPEALEPTLIFEIQRLTADFRLQEKVTLNSTSLNVRKRRKSFVRSQRLSNEDSKSSCGGCGEHNALFQFSIQTRRYTG